MQKSDWDVFKSKFSNNPEEIFEWFCYILFCKEFNQEMGIARYINQTGIETEPINNKGKLIGWQAKFYETKLSVNKSKILKMLDQVKDKYPDLDEIIFYTNQDWGEGKGANTLPKSKGEIEKKAEELQIKITWRTSSHFDSPFVSVENKQIASYFFNKNDSFLEELEQLKLSTKRIIEQIKNKINYKENEISLERDDIFKSLEESIETTKITLLTGESGIGKTGLIKRYYEKNTSSSSIFIIRAEQLKKLNNIQQLFNNNFYKLLEFYKNCKDLSKKIIIIDSLEKLNDLNNELFNDLLHELRDWKIVCTLQEENFSDIKNKFFKDQEINIIKLEKMKLEELEELALKNGFLLPKRNKKTLELIKIPFYLNEYLDSKLNEQIDFKQNIWIKKIGINVEGYFLDLVNEKIKNKKFYIERKNSDPQMINFLLEKNILKIENGDLYISHDLYEELAIEKIIERDFKRCIELEEFIKNIEKEFIVRKVFKSWVINKLSNNNEPRIKELIRELIFKNEHNETVWKDEILVAILLSDYSEIFFNEFKRELLKNECELLLKISNLLEKNCKDIDNEAIEISKKLNEKRIYLRPKGKGWEEFIKFFYKNFKEVKELEVGIAIIEEWCKLPTSKNKEILRESGKMILDLLPYKNNKKMFNILSYTCLEIKSELENFLNNLIDNQENNFKIYYFFIKYILSEEIISYKIKVNFPKQILKLANLFWKETKSINNYRHSFTESLKYGLKNNREINCMYASSYSTFISIFLLIYFEKTLDFIINFTNECMENYINFFPKEKYSQIKLYIDNDNIKTQIINEELWELYRGMNYDSCLLESIHMALEKNLLEGERTNKELEDILLKILKKSNSASLTAVVASTATSFFKTQMKINEILFKTKELFQYDKRRCKKENLISRLIRDPKLRKERKESDRLEHRKYELGDILFQYSINYRKLEEEKNLYKILDEHYKNLEEEKELKLQLMMIDLRNYKILEDETGIKLELNEDVQYKINKFHEKIEKNFSPIVGRNLNLKHWGIDQLNGVSTVDKYPQYENIENVKNDIKKLIKDLDKENNYIENKILTATLIISICALIKKYFNSLTKEEQEDSKNSILLYLKKHVIENKDYLSGLDIDQIIGILPDMLTKYPDSCKEVRAFLVWCLLNNTNENLKIKYFEKCILSLQNYHSKEIYPLTIKYLSLKPEYNNTRKNGKKESELFYRNNNTFDGNIDNIEINSISINLSKMELEDLLMPLKLLSYKITSKKQEELIKKIIFKFFTRLELSKKRNNYQEQEDFINIYSDLIIYNLENLDKDFIKLFKEAWIKFGLLEYLFELLIEKFLNSDNTYENFWNMWEEFFDIVVERLNNNSEEMIANSYLFALFKNENKIFSLTDQRIDLFYNLINELHKPEVILKPILNLLKNEKLKYYSEGVSLLELIIKKNPSVKLDNIILDQIGNYVKNILDQNLNQISLMDKEKIKKILIFLEKQNLSLASYLLEANY